MRGQKRVEDARERAFTRASIENKSASFKKMDCIATRLARVAQYYAAEVG
jgi:hypothetical protein